MLVFLMDMADTLKTELSIMYLRILLRLQNTVVFISELTYGEQKEKKYFARLMGQSIALNSMKVMAITIARQQHIDMTLAEGVVDLGDDGPDAAVASLAEPKAHRLKCIAQHTRKGL